MSGVPRKTCKSNRLFNFNRLERATITAVGCKLQDNVSTLGASITDEESLSNHLAAATVFVSILLQLGLYVMEEEKCDGSRRRRLR